MAELPPCLSGRFTGPMGRNQAPALPNGRQKKECFVMGVDSIPREEKAFLENALHVAVLLKVAALLCYRYMY